MHIWLISAFIVNTVIDILFPQRVETLVPDTSVASFSAIHPSEGLLLVRSESVEEGIWWIGLLEPVVSHLSSIHISEAHMPNK